MQRLIQSQGSLPSQYTLQRLRDKPFWLWDSTKHKEKDSKGNCCFNHIVGLPRKNGVQKPIFNYEFMLYKALHQRGYLNSDPSLLSSNPNNVKYRFKEKHLWVKKATGLGVTEFMRRFMAWLCLRNDDYRNSQMVIVTGPNLELAIKLIMRMKALFEHLGIIFDT